MPQHWTFGRRLAAGFAITVALAVGSTFVAIQALHGVVESKDRVIEVNAQQRLDAEWLQVARHQKSSALRGFLLVRDARLLDELRAAREEFAQAITRLKRVSDAESRAMVDAIERAEAEHQLATEQLIALRQGDAGMAEVARSFDQLILPRVVDLQRAIETFDAHAETLLVDAKQESTASATSASRLVLAIALAAILFSVGVAVVIIRSLGQQIGSAVSQVQSSSAELQAAASQQATGAREQATATSEITTTTSELLATSRQIAESAQRVAQIAQQTVVAARSGDTTVERGHESMAGIRRQVDLIVSHMLELGKKSQQIGGVLDIVSELAEQTNILAINATIEAAGAGEAGKRFAVVSEEIRKLADRVAGSSKEVRLLIDDIRSAVNATVMTTETGSKAVDLGAKQFGEVAAAFKQIADQLATTTEAAKEIELSTQQQTSAVEQVNLAVSSVAQAARETETSSAQTLQTASQLTTLSREILRIVQAQRAA